ncbi:MAG: septum formation initiator family protein [Patescibacteria group bacterium]|nr:septum formation initiator family protein [Patescibacteria group bacterium]
MRKNNKRKILTGLFLTPYFFTLVCLIVIAVIILPVYQNARERLAVNNEVADLQKQISSLEASNNDLTAMKKYLQSDQFVEKEARLNMNLKMPGEHVAVIENSGQSGNVAAFGAANGNSDKKNSNPVKWWNYFFGQ